MTTKRSGERADSWCTPTEMGGSVGRPAAACALPVGMENPNPLDEFFRNAVSSQRIPNDIVYNTVVGLLVEEVKMQWLLLLAMNLD